MFWPVLYGAQLLFQAGKVRVLEQLLGGGAMSVCV